MLLATLAVWQGHCYQTVDSFRTELLCRLSKYYTKCSSTGNVHSLLLWQPGEACRDGSACFRCPGFPACVQLMKPHLSPNRRGLDL